MSFRYYDELTMWIDYNKPDAIKNLAKRADIDSRNEDGESAIYYAIANKKISMIKALVDNGANVNLKNNESTTPIFYTLNSAQMTQLLIEHGANVNYKSHDGWTPLMSCLLTKHRIEDINIDVVKLLLENGAEVNVKNKLSGYTLLQHVNIPEIVELLIKYGANVNDVGLKGEPTLYLAFIHNNINKAKLLLKHGADINSAFRFALYHNDLNTIKQILKTV